MATPFGWTPEELAESRKEFADLVESDDVVPIFDEEEAIGSWSISQNARKKNAERSGGSSGPMKRVANAAHLPRPYRSRVGQMMNIIVSLRSACRAATLSLALSPARTICASCVIERG
jgi:hypothetical protein